MIPRNIRSTTWRGLAVILAVTFVLAMPLPGPWHTNWRAKLLDLGHIPLFAALTWALRSWATGGWMSACLLSIGIAGAGEIMQATIPMLGRSGDWDDFVRGAIGSALMAVFAYAFKRPCTIGRVAIAMFAAAALLAWPAYDAAPTLLDAWHAHRQFPVLADFSTPFEAKRFLPRGRKPPAVGPFRDGPESSIGTIRFESETSEQYPGVDFLPPCNDWRGYRKLVIEFDAVGSLRFSVAIKDFRKANGYGERFNREDMKFESGRQRLEIPLDDIATGPKTSRLDLSQIQIVQIFRNLEDQASGHVPGSQMNLHRIALE